MDGREFYQRVADHPQLEWLGIKKGETSADDAALVGNTDRNSKFAIHLTAILKHDWEELLGIFLGHRGPRIMTHVTRIVGYYSQLQNWNRSKLAELKDRHKGDYALPDFAAPTSAIAAD
jgi:hypothetical protein